MDWLSPHRGVWLFRPTASASATSRPTTEPTICLLFGWLNARVEHLRKYASKLHELYPSSIIVIVECTNSFFFASQRAQDAALEPVVQTLLNLSQDGQLSTILIHSFSNAGGFQLVKLQSLLRRSWPPSLPPARCALILDSGPGDRGLPSVLSSMAPKNTFLYFLSVPIFALLYGIFVLRTMCQGRPPLFTELRDALLVDELLPPLMRNPVPRLYIYSASDDVVKSRFIEEHIALAAASGVIVATERYTQSDHVAHARADASRYWDRVQNFWREATETRNS